MNTLHILERPSNILQRVRKSSPRSILVMAFVMLCVGFLALVIGSIVLSKIMMYLVLFSMVTCVVLGFVNKKTAVPNE